MTPTKQNMLAHTEPGEPMRMMAALLANRGFDVRLPRHEESRMLRIVDAGRGRCEIDVEDNASVAWEYFACNGTAPPEVSGMVLRMLDADDAGLQFDAKMHLAGTLKGAVGRDMSARGLEAQLKVYEDRDCYDVTAEVVVTNPARPERGLVRIADDGMVRWECDYDQMPDGAIAVADTTANLLVSGQAEDSQA